MAAVFRQIEDVAVGKPGQLRGELVALARRRADGHCKTVVDDARDLAFDAADMIEVGDDAIADRSDARAEQGKAARRHVDDLAREFTAVRQHVSSKQMHFDALKAAPIGGRLNHMC